MSAAMTHVETAAGGYLARGHVTRAEALAEYRRHLESQLASLRTQQVALEADKVRVYHQYGVTVVRTRREVFE